MEPSGEREITVPIFIGRGAPFAPAQVVTAVPQLLDTAHHLADSQLRLGDSFTAKAEMSPTTNRPPVTVFA